ncbi:pectin acetylesterase 8-like isoform X2 [Lycium barbarum]|uniref:pectin acetylesterase 8-like isoform X2 n=1 Tax=Lycium barbarum TaxID=112863 RepID=UPI00293F3D45|nr:pectin acetylesterase 8-like isoform X2 [Lycium barbarum]
MLYQKEQYAWMDHLQRTILNQDLGKELETGLYNFQGEHGAQASKAVWSVSRIIIRVLQILWDHIHFKGFIARIKLQIQATNLHFRGARIFEAVMEDVLARGLKNVKNAILAGSSAGGYPAMLYCDRFRSLLPNTQRVKCLVDAGYFIHVKNPKQAKGFEDIFNSLVTLHGSTKALPKSCTSKMKPLLCLFPENIQQYIKTPLFITMSTFDIYQVLTTVEDHLHDLIENGTLTASQKKALRAFRPEFLSTLPKPNNPKLRGVFIDSVNHHTSLLTRWSPENATMINNLSLPKAFADWYFDRKYWYVIDEHDLPIPKSHEHDNQVPKIQEEML